MPNEEQVSRCERIFMRKVSGTVWVGAVAIIVTIFTTLYYATYQTESEIRSIMLQQNTVEAYETGVRDGKISALDNRVTGLEDAILEINKKLDFLSGIRAK
jgi:hypothetical protein